MAGEHLDLTSDEPRMLPEVREAEPGRRFVGIHFTCCSIYLRIYLNREGTAYEGACPRCYKRVRLKVGPGGTDNRFFTAQ